MDVVKTICPDGHYYNSARFDKCPVCDPSQLEGGNNPVTISDPAAGFTELKESDRKERVSPQLAADEDCTEWVAPEIAADEDCTEVVSPEIAADEDCTEVVSPTVMD